MSKNKCGDCRNYMSCESATCVSDTACDGFKSDKKTLFDKITASPEVLAEDMVYSVGKVWASTLIVDTTFDSYEEAIAATVAKLKEVEK